VNPQAGSPVLFCLAQTEFRANLGPQVKTLISIPVVAIILLLKATTLPAVAVTPSQAAKGEIPPDLFIQLKTVPLEENAIINWRRAMRTKPSMNAQLKDAIKFAWMPKLRRPGADQIDELRAWLARHRESLELMEESLAKPQAQWPERNASGDQPELLALPLFIRARLFAADELTEQGEYRNAVKSLRGSLQLAQRGIEADGAMIQYLIAASARTMVHGAITRLAARRNTPPALLEQLLAELPALDGETNSYARMLRVEFTYYAYPALDLHKLTEAWSAITETNIALSLYPEPLRRPFKILLDPLLVSLHPKPLDEIAELQSTARHYRTYLTNAASAWTNRNDSVEAEAESIQKQLLADIEPLMELTRDEPLPLSRPAAQKARSAYLNIENPLGRLFRCSIGGLTGSDIRVFRSRTEREAIRAILGLLIFERQKGQLPGSLKALVEEKILPSLPQDFFSGVPLAYSRERRLIWSVGEDGTDDNGTGNPALKWTSEDAVWEIPELGR
jgi:hypothetical protein